MFRFKALDSSQKVLFYLYFALLKPVKELVINQLRILILFSVNSYRQESCINSIIKAGISEANSSDKNLIGPGSSKSISISLYGTEPRVAVKQSAGVDFRQVDLALKRLRQKVTE